MPTDSLGPTVPAPALTPSSAPADLKPRLKASYDAIARRYNEWTVPHSATRLRFLTLLLDRLSAASSASNVAVLELGCGAGLPVTQILLRQGYTVTANDLSSTQIGLARENLVSSAALGENASEAEAAKRLTLVEGDMLALEMPAASLDAVVGMYSLIHLPREEQVALLRMIAGWLKPGGWLLANFAEEELPGVEMERWLEEERGWMFWSGWGREGTVEKVRDVGLAVEVEEVVEDVVDARFLWILARKGEGVVVGK